MILTLKGNPFVINKTYKIWIFDMITETELGKKTINEIVSSFLVSELRILIGGGDGSIISFIECLGEDVVNSGKCIFGIIPLGTGNDLSRCLNFGGMLLKVKPFKLI